MKGSIQNRDAFLDQIAKQLGRERKTTLTPPVWKHNPQEEVLKDATLDELVDVLKLQCTKIHTELIMTSKSELSVDLEKKIKEFGSGPIVTWKDERYEQFGIQSLLTEKLPSVQEDVFEWDPNLGKENIAKAEQANIGITISEITLAESGTVVLYSGPNRGRTISFLPTHSIVIVPKSTIVPRMTQAAKFIREKLKNGEQVPSAINFITGPSNSADIEMNLVVGVHGPVKAVYMLVEDL
ncbi:lactate utilization protein C [Bacillus timonensis]|uniref:Lactate utilization protein C n=1 Tax=Bacillus timonensis TaxID=1033734 RepID=A0A4S3PWC8_9BACI|nr:lactate utilization protein C [Bacillus timonensis]THE14149.1 lactate utilization protein C [Bacillus timonensis]